MSTLLPLYINVNVNGIPTLRSLSVTVGAASVAFDFNNHRNIGRPFRGLLIVDLAQIIPAGTTATLPIVFTTSGGNAQPLLKENNEPVTVADIPGTGVYILWYDNESNRLQVPNSLV